RRGIKPSPGAMAARLPAPGLDQIADQILAAIKPPTPRGTRHKLLISKGLCKTKREHPAIPRRVFSLLSGGGKGAEGRANTIVWQPTTRRGPITAARRGRIGALRHP